MCVCVSMSRSLRGGLDGRCKVDWLLVTRQSQSGSGGVLSVDIRSFSSQSRIRFLYLNFVVLAPLVGY